MPKAEATVEQVGGYRVVRNLAGSGASDVLLAKVDGPLGSERTVVLKLFPDPAGEGDAALRTFAREAAAYTRLSHPTIARLFDFFALPHAVPPAVDARGGQLCIVIEHVDGPTLGRLRTLSKASAQELDDVAAIHLASSIFDALATAHGAVDPGGDPAPVVHGDVNPSNVLVSWEGQVKLADFGVARATSRNVTLASVTTRGTYGYLAPEQAAGGAPTPRSDVYAAAVVLWELLTKRRAFQRGALPEAEALRAMAEPRIPSLDTLRPDLDPVLRDAVRQALEPRADLRTITAEAIAASLSSLVAIDEGRRHLVGVLHVVRVIADSVPGSIPPAHRSSLRPPPDVVSSTIAPPATIHGVAPPALEGSFRSTPPRRSGAPRPGSFSQIPATTVSVPAPRSGGAAIAQIGLVSKPMPVSALASLPGKAPPVPPARRSSGVDFEAVRRTSASARLAVSIPDAGVRASSPSIRISDPGPAVSSDALAPPLPVPSMGANRAGEPEEAGPAAPEIGRLPAAPPPMQSAFPGDVAVSVDPVVAKVVVTASLPPRVDSAAPSTQKLAPPPPEDLAETPRSPSRASFGETQPLAGVGLPDAGLLDEGEDGRSSAVEPEVPPSGEPRRPSYSTPPLALPAMTPTAPYVAPGPLLEAATRPPLPSDFPEPSVAPRSVAPPQRRSEGPGALAPRRPRAASAASLPAPPPRSAVGGASRYVIAGLLGVAGVSLYLAYRSDPKSDDPSEPAVPESIATNAASAAPRRPVAPAKSVAAVPASAAVPLTTPAPKPSSSLASPHAPSAAPAPSASAAPAPVSKSPIAEGMGIVRTPGTVPGRRIFVDDRTLGQTPASVTVKCGPHVVKLGSAGKPQQIDVPCGGEIDVTDKL